MRRLSTHWYRGYAIHPEEPYVCTDADGTPVRGPRWSIDRPIVVGDEVLDWRCEGCVNTLREARAAVDRVCDRATNAALEDGRIADCRRSRGATTRSGQNLA